MRRCNTKEKKSLAGKLIQTRPEAIVKSVLRYLLCFQFHLSG